MPMAAPSGVSYLLYSYSEVFRKEIPQAIPRCMKMKLEVPSDERFPCFPFRCIT